MAALALAQSGHMAPSQREPTTATAPLYVPALPAELVLHIIRLSLPQIPAPSNDFAERSAALRSYALVSPTWRDLAQRELFANPTVRAGASIESFLEVLRARPALRTVVRGIALGRCKLAAHNTREDAVGVGEVLATCSELEEVHLYGLRNVRLVWLVVLKALQKLIFYDIGLTAECGVRIELPLLRHLSFSKVGPRRLPLAECPILVLPALRTLSLCDWIFEPVITGLSSDLVGVVSADWDLAPLSRVSQALAPPCNVPVLWALPTWLDTSADWGQLDPENDVPISHMRYTFTYSDPLWRNRNLQSLRRLSATLKSGTVPALAGLRSLYLQAYLKEDEKIAELLEVCRERGVAVFFEGTHPLGLDDSEVLEEFARARRDERRLVEGKQGPSQEVA